MKYEKFEGGLIYDIAYRWVKLGMTREEFENKMDSWDIKFRCSNDTKMFAIAAILRQEAVKDFIWNYIERHTQNKGDIMCDGKETVIEKVSHFNHAMSASEVKKLYNVESFELRLIWNDKRTACFIPDEFSNAKIWDVPAYAIDISLKNGDSVRLCCPPDIEKAKTRLQELMKEIGAKLAYHERTK